MGMAPDSPPTNPTNKMDAHGVEALGFRVWESLEMQTLKKVAKRKWAPRGEKRRRRWPATPVLDISSPCSDGREKRDACPFHPKQLLQRGLISWDTFQVSASLFFSLFFRSKSSTRNSKLVLHADTALPRHPFLPPVWTQTWISRTGVAGHLRLPLLSSFETSV